MRIISLCFAFLIAFAVLSCKNISTSQKKNTNNNYYFKCQTIEAFINIDYEAALENADRYSIFPPETGFLHTNMVTPQLLYISTPDCSFCIVATLDFMIAFSYLNTDFETPIILLKDGDRKIFDFYLEKQLSGNIDKNIVQKLKTFHIINGYCETINTANDGVYLIYRNKVLNYMPWPPQPR